MDQRTQRRMRELFGEPIVVYTAQDAANDGNLVPAEDLVEDAANIFEGSFVNRPVYLTQALFGLIDKADENPRSFSDWVGISNDVVTVARCSRAILRALEQAEQIGCGSSRFVVKIVGAGRKKNHHLKVSVERNALTPHTEPCLIYSLAEED